MSEELKSAQARIACLEGEIAKRDETIARLEPQLNRAIQANYDLREELAACRVAVENCELFRARVAELEARIVWLECEAQVESFKPEELRIDTYHAGEHSGFLHTNETAVRITHLPTGAYVESKDERSVHRNKQKCLDMLPAAIAAKAQGVVMPDVNAAAKALCNRHAMICGVDADDQWKEYSQDFIADAETVLANARLNAAHVQQVSVQDGWKLVPVDPTPGMIDAALRSEDTSLDPRSIVITDYRAMLAAAPAAPAADAGVVDMYRHLQKVTPYRFKKIQDASITDGGDVMYFHKDRFDAALLADMAAHCAAKGVV